MQINVLLFAIARESAGADSIAIHVAEDACAGDVLDELGRSIPAIADLVPSCRLAIDNAYVTRDAAIDGHTEFALIPPVSGG